jgi:hypothetical protein
MHFHTASSSAYCVGGTVSSSRLTGQQRLRSETTFPKKSTSKSVRGTDAGLKQTKNTRQPQRKPLSGLTLRSPVQNMYTGGCPVPKQRLVAISSLLYIVYVCILPNMEEYVWISELVCL